MSGVTGEIGFKIGAAGSQLPQIGGKVITAEPNQVALTVNGAPTQYALTVFNLVSPNVLNPADGVLIKAGVNNNDIALEVLSAGTNTLAKFLASGSFTLGWNSSSDPLINANSTGTIQVNGVPFQIGNLLDSTQYFVVNSTGVLIENVTAGNPSLQVNEPAAGNAQHMIVQAPAVVIGTSTPNTWGTGTHYPILQMAGIGGIMGTGTIGLNIMAGGLYYNGTNYIYGQAGTGIQASLGTGSFTVSCFNTSGTAAGIATPTVVFSIGGTVTSNKIQGYGSNAAALVDMTPDTGTFTGTWAGFITAPVNTAAYWSRQGNQVMLLIPYGTGSKSGAPGNITFAPLPASIQSSKTLYVAYPFAVSGGTAVVGGGQVLVTAANGTLIFSQGAAGAGFAGTAAATIGSTGAFQVLTYPIAP